jgi:DNA invertase Pin-like site-specific DNA recombinase
MKLQGVKNVGYVRVSSLDQNEERQIQLFKEKAISLDKLFLEKLSGKDIKRPVLQEMLQYLREGDTLYVESFSRLTRSLKDLYDLLDFFEKKKINLISLKENFDFTTSNGKFMLSIFGAVSQLERDLLKERQMEGIRLAKSKGLYKGRKKIKKPLNFDECYSKYQNSTRFNPYKLKDLLRDTGLTSTTCYKFIKLQEMK